MQAKETLNMYGRLKIEIFGEHGELKQQTEVPNLVVTTGKDFIASRIKDATLTPMSHMAVGEDNTAVVVADTALGNEIARVALTSTTVTANDVVYSASYGAGVGTGALVEAGIFNDSSAGIMLCRTVFAVINKGPADSMTITWTVQVA
jgi:negative regulator of sigma E activity